MWYPNVRVAGIAGILAGLALTGEFVFFALSGFNQATFNDPSTALPFLRDHGVYVRVAVLFGATGIVLTLVFLAGLAAVLRERTPTLSVGTLLFGIVGNVGDGLVALSFWLGIPAFLDLATRDQSAAHTGWGAFAALTSGFQGFGNLFLGMSLLAAGLAIVTRRALPLAVGVVAILAGVAAVAGVLGIGTSIAFIASLALVIVFRVWAGIQMAREATLQLERAGAPAAKWSPTA
jgi:hypothetical protein